jgi:hypothetical protein
VTTTNLEAFSISHAAILNGTTGLEETWGGFYGVREGSIAVDMGDFNNEGDDAVLSTWFWFNYAEVTVTAGYVPFSLISNVTGVTLTSSGANPNEQFDLPLWTLNSLNIPNRPMLIRMPSKDSNGLVRKMDILLYKCQFKPIAFDGPRYKDGLLVNYSCRALISATNEKGQALTDSAIGRLVSHI